MTYNAFDLVFGIWFLILFGFAVAEMLKLRGNYFPFALGALGGLICYVMGLDILFQIIAFAAVSAVSFLALRPLFIRFARHNASRGEEGLDQLVGLEGRVIAKIDMSSDTGRVQVAERPVKARPVDPQQKYNVGDRIVVADVDGDMLVVKKAKKRG